MSTTPQTPSPSDAYAALTRHFGRIGRLEGAAEVLYWDMATMMPSGGAQGRGEQLAALEGLKNDLLSDTRIGEWLEAAESRDQDFDGWQQANLREMRRAFSHATAVPTDLVEALTRAGSACESVWREARPADDFAQLIEPLTEVFRLVREVGQAKADALGGSPYEALMDQYEPGLTTARLDAVFGELASFLPELTEAVLAKQAAAPSLAPLPGPFATDKQRALGLKVMEVMGFDFERGRLDVSLHPFCGGSGDDVRITTRYREDDLVQSLMGVIHETGHALYELGLPREQRYQPVGQARGMGLHESQSLLMEMQAGRSPEFLSFLAPLARDIFGGQGEAWTPENFKRVYTQVERGLIRVDADEVTYPAHVIMRYRLERALVSGDLLVKDLPGAWRAGMKELVGIAPETDRDGCMQDIHWMEGLVGYFPSYTLGAMSAAQLFAAATEADASIRPELARGNFGPLLSWLSTHVHGQASRPVSTDELLTQATGRPLDVQIFRAHLESRYLT